ITHHILIYILPYSFIIFLVCLLSIVALLHKFDIIFHIKLVKDDIFIMNNLKKKATIAFSILLILSLICIGVSAWLIISEASAVITLVMFFIDFVVLCALLTIVFTAYFYKKRMKQLEKQEKKHR